MSTASKLEYLVIAECPLEQEIRIKKFLSRKLANRYGNQQYGEKWDWQWQVSVVTKTPPRAPSTVYPMPARVGPLRPQVPVFYQPRRRP